MGRAERAAGGSAGLAAPVKFEYSQPNARPFSNQGKTMKRYLLIMLSALFCAGAFTPTTTKAADVFIETGDRPYYSHGPWYWNHGYRWYWRSGHWGWRYGQRVWIHRHYARRYKSAPFSPACPPTP